jgi:hypothetical protein
MIRQKYLTVFEETVTSNECVIFQAVQFSAALHGTLSTIYIEASDWLEDLNAWTGYKHE